MDFITKKSNAIKVLIVDDSAFMRKVLSEIIDSEESMVVIGTATDGKDALSKIRLLNPDVITLDVDMPIMDGINCLQEIMLKFPRPVIMISSGTDHGAELTIKALDEGAVDFIEKSPPSSNSVLIAFFQEISWPDTLYSIVPLVVVDAFTFLQTKSKLSVLFLLL